MDTHFYAEIVETPEIVDTHFYEYVWGESWTPTFIME
jgi:hypothetical protein